MDAGRLVDTFRIRTMTLGDARSRFVSTPHSVLPMPWGTLVGFVLAILSMLLVGAVTLISLQNRTESRERVAHSVAVVGGLERLQARIVAAETGQRGYLLTGEESYLDPYVSANSEVASGQQELRKLLADSPEQLQRL